MKYVAAVLVLLAVVLGWRYCASRPARVPPGYLDTYKSLGEAMVEAGGGAQGGILVIASADDTNQPTHQKMLAGVRRAAGDAAVVEVAKTIDPMAAQNGQGALAWSDVESIWQQHADARLLVLLLDVRAPSAGEIAALRKAERAVVYKPLVELDAARELAKSAAVRAVVLPRSGAPAPADAPAWQRAFEILRAAP